jgi:hypothetical protein
MSALAEHKPWREFPYPDSYPVGGLLSIGHSLLGDGAAGEQF